MWAVGLRQPCQGHPRRWSGNEAVKKRLWAKKHPQTGRPLNGDVVLEVRSIALASALRVASRGNGETNTWMNSVAARAGRSRHSHDGRQGGNSHVDKVASAASQRIAALKTRVQKKMQQAKEKPSSSRGQEVCEQFDGDCKGVLDERGSQDGSQNLVLGRQPKLRRVEQAICSMSQRQRACDHAVHIDERDAEDVAEDVAVLGGQVGDRKKLQVSVNTEDCEDGAAPSVTKRRRMASMHDDNGRRRMIANVGAESANGAGERGNVNQNRGRGLAAESSGDRKRRKTNTMRICDSICEGNGGAIPKRVQHTVDFAEK